MKKYDLQKHSKIPYLETTGMPTRILLRERRFKCYQCSKMMVSETSIVKKNISLRGSIIFVVGKSPMDLMEPIFV